MDSVKQFKTARKVGTPIVAIRTFDAASTVRSIKASFEKPDEVPMIIWDCVTGLNELTPAGKIELQEGLLNNEKVQDGEDVGLTLDSTLRMAQLSSKRRRKNLILFVSNAHLQWADSNATAIQGIWNLRDTFKMFGNMLVLLTSPGAPLPNELASDVLIIEESLPTEAELETIIKKTYAAAKLPEPSEETIRKATDALIGLPAFPAEQAASMSLETKGKSSLGTLTGDLNMHNLWDRKRQIINQAPGLSVWAGAETMNDVGGLNEIKKFLKDIMEGDDPPKVILFQDEIEKAYAGTGTELSGVKTELTGSMLSWQEDQKMDGIIAIGPPGVSKSALVKGVGNTYGVPVIKFDLAGMQNKHIGESNSNLRTAQKTVDAISGGRVLVIATCNGIAALPPELRRRFNMGIFFFDIPQTEEERNEIWKIWRKAFGIPTGESNPSAVGWTGAEIKQCCLLAHKLGRTLAHAALSVIPITQSSPETVHALRSMCDGKYLSASNPGVYRYNRGLEPIGTFAETERIYREELN